MSTLTKERTAEETATVHAAATPAAPAPEVKLSASEQDAVVRTAAGEETKATVSAVDRPGEARAWNSQADVD